MTEPTIPNRATTAMTKSRDTASMSAKCRYLERVEGDVELLRAYRALETAMGRL